MVNANSERVERWIPGSRVKNARPGMTKEIEAAQYTLLVITGLGPGIHLSAKESATKLDCRVIGEPPGLAPGEPNDRLRDAVLRTAMPGNDERVANVENGSAPLTANPIQHRGYGFRARARRNDERKSDWSKLKTEIGRGQILQPRLKPPLPLLPPEPAAAPQCRHSAAPC